MRLQFQFDSWEECNDLLDGFVPQVHLPSMRLAVSAGAFMITHGLSEDEVVYRIVSSGHRLMTVPSSQRPIEHKRSLLVKANVFVPIRVALRWHWG